MPVKEDAVAAASLPEKPAVNYFSAAETAERYAASRPRGQSRVLAVMARVLAGHLPVERALDVGCGTGHSTAALLPYARRVVGVEPSREMLAQAEPHAGIEYRMGYAEQLPLRDASFDLVTVSSAYHWFDQECFLAEAARVLRPRGWLVLYKAGATGRMSGCPEFEAWRREVLRGRYPKVARHAERLNGADAARFGIEEIACEESTRQVEHAMEDYVENLLTHSRFIRVVENGREPIAAVRAWLRAELAPFFRGGVATLTHEAWIHVLQRKDA